MRRQAIGQREQRNLKQTQADQNTAEPGRPSGTEKSPEHIQEIAGSRQKTERTEGNNNDEKRQKLIKQRKTEKYTENAHEIARGDQKTKRTGWQQRE